MLFIQSLLQGALLVHFVIWFHCFRPWLFAIPSLFLFQKRSRYAKQSNRLRKKALSIIYEILHLMSTHAWSVQSESNSYVKTFTSLESRKTSRFGALNHRIMGGSAWCGESEASLGSNQRALIEIQHLRPAHDTFAQQHSRQARIMLTQLTSDRSTVTAGASCMHIEYHL